MKTLILFSTRDGQTREIASYLASELKELGIQADVANVHRIEEPQWENYDRVVIGASIRYGHYHSAFQEFVKKHATRLNSMPSAFYSVNLVARKPEKRTPQTNSYARKFLMNSQWRPDRCAVIAGALRYPRYRWYDRFMIKLIMRCQAVKRIRAKKLSIPLGAGGEFRPRNRPFNRQTDAEISIKNKKCAVRKLF
ncbi:protoporphyrinogen oxidase [Escherichia coli]|nr:protoporphyrinogen oxidase [Escherichia coli]